MDDKLTKIYAQGNERSHGNFSLQINEIAERNCRTPTTFSQSEIRSQRVASRFTRTHQPRPDMQPETPRRSTDRREPPQPLSALHVDGALLMKPTVVAACGLAGSTIDRKVAKGEFPKPVKLSARCTRWRSQDVRRWLTEQVPA